MKKLSSNKKIFLIILTIVLIILALSSYILIKTRYYDINLLFDNYTPQNKIVTEANLRHDINIMQQKDGVNVEFHILSNKKSEQNFPEDVFYDSNRNIKEGTLVFMGISNRMLVDSKKPLEVRFIMRIMLYIQEHKFDPILGEILGISAGFTRDALQKPDGEGDQPFKISSEEFINLYKEANVSTLDTEKQIDILTNIWMKNTGYWRRGLNGQEDKPAG